jgi:hypothetical protein
MESLLLVYCQAQSQLQLNWTELAVILYPPTPARRA